MKREEMNESEKRHGDCGEQAEKVGLIRGIMRNGLVSGVTRGLGEGWRI